MALLLGADSSTAAGREPKSEAQEEDRLPGDMAAVQVIQDWPEVSREVAVEMMQRYGEPDGVTPDHLMWSNEGKFHEISVYRDAIEHNFPYRHMDVVKHTVYMRVPSDKLDDISEFNGSLTVNRTRGTISAFCDSEQHNVLSLNLAADIINNQKTVQEARQTFASLTAESGQMTTRDSDREYIEALRFDIVSPNVVRDPGESFTGSTGGTGNVGLGTGTTGRTGMGTTGRGIGTDTLGIDTLNLDRTNVRDPFDQRNLDTMRTDTLYFDTLGTDTIGRDTLNMDTSIYRAPGTGTGGPGPR